MSSIVTEQGLLLHYQSIGRGEPVILLHGWVNSWRVWRDSMLALRDTGKYRVYTLDFWGFGESSKGPSASAAVPASSFEIDSYVEMVYEFMEKLGIQQATILGHSMGGTVALKMALAHPDRVKKVAVVGSPVVGSSLNRLLRLAGNGYIAKVVWQFPVIRQTILRLLLQKDTSNIREMISDDLEQATLESFFQSIGDLRDTDLRTQLTSLQIPTLGIYGAKDNIVSPKNALWLQGTMRTAQIAMMKRSRHFPMVDEPQEFLHSLDHFLNNGYTN